MVDSRRGAGGMGGGDRGGRVRGGGGAAAARDQGGSLLVYGGDGGRGGLEGPRRRISLRRHHAGRNCAARTREHPGRHGPRRLRRAPARRCRRDGGAWRDDHPGRDRRLRRRAHDRDGPRPARTGAARADRACLQILGAVLPHRLGAGCRRRLHRGLPSEHLGSLRLIPASVPGRRGRRLDLSRAGEPALHHLAGRPRRDHGNAARRVAPQHRSAQPRRAQLERNGALRRGPSRARRGWRRGRVPGEA